MSPIDQLWASVQELNIWQFACYIGFSIQDNMSLIYVHSYGDVWSTKISNQILYMGISIICHVYMMLWLCIHIDVLIPYVVVEYNVNKDFYCSGVFHHPSIFNTSVVYLGRLFISRWVMYQDAHLRWIITFKLLQFTEC